ncbi:MAG: hypothetical protein SF029_00410 [bacterium]|nr:hypothetical protein [bacterium]
MNLEPVSTKHMNEMEQLVNQLLDTMRKAKLQDNPAYRSLQQLGQELGESRRNRFDSKHSQYSDY